MAHPHLSDFTDRPRIKRAGLLKATALLGALTVATGLHAASIFVPNASFESQSGVGQPYGVNINVDSWQKPDKPAYFTSIETNYGIFWAQTAGVFVDTNPYANRDGTQAAFMLDFPQVALFQDYNTTDWRNAPPTHDFNATFQPGQSYSLTLGLFGKQMTAGTTLELSLYYRDNLNNMVTVAATDVIYSAAAFPVTSPLNLVDYQVNLPTVQAGDAWAGKNIGIKIESVYGDGAGYWDMDNVRLTAVPEPAVLGLSAVGLCGLWFFRPKFRRA